MNSFFAHNVLVVNPSHFIDDFWLAKKHVGVVIAGILVENARVYTRVCVLALDHAKSWWWTFKIKGRSKMASAFYLDWFVICYSIVSDVPMRRVDCVKYYRFPIFATFTILFRSWKFFKVDMVLSLYILNWGIFTKVISKIVVSGLLSIYVS